MADFIRVSYTALEAIPEEHRFLAHSMYEDSDLDNATAAEAAFDFIERKAPGLFVGVLANDSVTPPCCNAEGHYNCDFYEPYWYTVWILATDWERYKDAVMTMDQEHKARHQCRVAGKA